MEPEFTQRPGRLAKRTARLLVRREDDHLGSLGLASAQVPVLLALRQGVPLTQKDLARLAEIEQPTMALLLVRMKRAGLVSRAPHPSDKRSSLISLTPLAQAKVSKAKAILAKADKAALRGLSERETATLIRLLRRVITNLEPSIHPASPAQR